MRNLLNLCNVTGFIKSPALQPSTPSGESWTTKYEANALPENATPAWTKTGVESASTFEISPSGYFHAVVPATETTNIDYLYNPGAIDATIGVTMEVRVKVLSTSIYDQTGDWVNNYAFCCISDASANQCSPFYIYSDAVVLEGNWNSETQTYAPYVKIMDTTDGYHTYRITLKSGKATLYVDNQYAGEVNTEATTTTYFDFYPASNVGTTALETSWDYVYCDTTGAYAPT